MTIKRNKDAKSTLNSILIEISKSVFVVALIIALGVWQFDFAYKSVLSHPQLNLLIIFTFIGGVVAAFITAYRLFNEYHVLQAMKETQHDFAEMEKLGDDGGVTRLVRAAEPGIVITQPRLFGEVREIVVMENQPAHRAHTSST